MVAEPLMGLKSLSQAEALDAPPQQWLMCLYHPAWSIVCLSFPSVPTAWHKNLLEHGSSWELPVLGVQVELWDCGAEE